MIFLTFFFMSIYVHLRSTQAFLVKSNQIFSVNGVIYYYPKCIILQGNRCVKGNNIDINKLESKARMQNFLFRNSKDFINCNLVLYAFGRCDAGSSFVSVTRIC